MRCLQHQHENSDTALLCSVCGSKVSALAEGAGLPYAWWKLEAQSELTEMGSSVSAIARDDRTGEVYSIREYFPSSGNKVPLGEDVHLQDFIAAAKSLHSVSVRAMRVLFAYTREGRWYTVSQRLTGTSLLETIPDGRAPAAEVRKWLRAMLVVLDAIHRETIASGPLHHGNISLANVIVEDLDAGYRVELVNSVYLERFVAEIRMTPEQFRARDLRAIALNTLRLLDGRQELGDQTHRLDGVADVVLGATLDYVLRPAARAPNSAGEVIIFLDDLSRAEFEGSKVLYQAAYQRSGAGRLRPVLNAPSTSEARVPVATATSAHAVPPAATPPEKTIDPSPAPFPAVPPPPQPKPRAQPQSSGGAAVRTTQRRSLARRIGRLIGTTLVVAALAIAAVLFGVVLLLRSVFPKEAPKSPTIVAQPNVIHPGQSSLLQWSAKGFSHVELNGQAVHTSGSRSVSPVASTTYRLSFRDSGSKTGSAETRLVVVPTRGDARKPRAAGTGEPDDARHPSRRAEVPGTPTIEFVSAQKQINFGEQSEIRWSVTNAKGITVDPPLSRENKPLPLKGSAFVSPSVTTQYSLSAEGTSGSVSRSLAIRVVPQILSFEGRPTGDGCTWTLTSEAQGARSLRIETAEGIVPTHGRTDVHPIRDTTYTLRAEGAETLATSDLQIRVLPEAARDCSSRRNE